MLLSFSVVPALVVNRQEQTKGPFFGVWWTAAIHTVRRPGRVQAIMCRVLRILLWKGSCLPVCFQFVAELRISFSHRWAISWVVTLELSASMFSCLYKKEVLCLLLTWGLVDVSVLDIQGRTGTRSTWLLPKESLCDDTFKSDSISLCIVTVLYSLLQSR